MLSAALPSDIRAFLERIDPTVLTGRYTNEAWAEFLKKNGGGSGSINDMEVNWLNSKSATNAGKGRGDALNNYGSVKGYSGTPGDKIRQYLRQAATQ